VRHTSGSFLSQVPLGSHWRQFLRLCSRWLTLTPDITWGSFRSSPSLPWRRFFSSFYFGNSWQVERNEGWIGRGGRRKDEEKRGHSGPPVSLDSGRGGEFSESPAPPGPAEVPLHRFDERRFPERPSRVGAAAQQHGAARRQKQLMRRPWPLNAMSGDYIARGFPASSSCENGIVITSLSTRIVTSENRA